MSSANRPCNIHTHGLLILSQMIKLWRLVFAFLNVAVFCFPFPRSLFCAPFATKTTSVASCVTTTEWYVLTAVECSSSSTVRGRVTVQFESWGRGCLSGWARLSNSVSRHNKNVIFSCQIETYNPALMTPRWREYLMGLSISEHYAIYTARQKKTGH